MPTPSRVFWLVFDVALGIAVAKLIPPRWEPLATGLVDIVLVVGLLWVVREMARGFGASRTP